MAIQRKKKFTSPKKVGRPEIGSAHKSQKVGGRRPARPNRLRRQWTKHWFSCLSWHLARNRALPGLQFWSVHGAFVLNNLTNHMTLAECTNTWSWTTFQKNTEVSVLEQLKTEFWDVHNGIPLSVHKKWNTLIIMQYISKKQNTRRQLNIFTNPLKNGDGWTYVECGFHGNREPSALSSFSQHSMQCYDTKHLSFR